jgi:hypothetical protein
MGAPTSNYATAGIGLRSTQTPPPWLGGDIIGGDILFYEPKLSNASVTLTSQADVSAMLLLLIVRNP